MSIIDMRQFCLKELNRLDPHSRRRDGIIHIIRRLNNVELAAAAERQRKLFEALDRGIHEVSDEMTREDSMKGTM